MVDLNGTGLAVESGAAEVSWNLFAAKSELPITGLDQPNAVLGPNYFEDGYDSVYPNGVYGSPQFQEPKFDCESNLWVHWNDDVLVDFAVGTLEPFDIDGSAHDYGAWGGPESYPLSAVYDADNDGVRNDLDCAIDDPERFPVVDGDANCPIDGSGDPMDIGAGETGEPDGSQGNRRDVALFFGGGGCSTSPTAILPWAALLGLTLRRRNVARLKRTDNDDCSQR